MVIKHFRLHNRLLRDVFQVATTIRNTLDLLSYFRQPADIRDQRTSKSSHIIWCLIMRSHVFKLGRLLDNKYTPQIRPCFVYFPGSPSFAKLFQLKTISVGFCNSKFHNFYCIKIHSSIQAT